MSDILEPRDISRILSDGVLVTLPDGYRALPVLLVLHPASAIETLTRIRMGAIEQTYMIEPVPPVMTVLSPTASADVGEAQEEVATDGPASERDPGDQSESVQHDGE